MDVVDAPKKKKHAYLVMVHRDVEQVCSLLRALDHPLNDVYLHADLKFEEASFESFAPYLSKAQLHFFQVKSIGWGTYDQFDIELSLVEWALQEGGYSYYHLLSGQDFPLKKQDDIHSYFEGRDEEFIHFARPEEWDRVVRERVAVARYPRLMRRSSKGYALEKCLSSIQQTMEINRLYADTRYGFGGAWFSVTDQFARDFVKHRSWFQERFSRALCVDEHAIQSFALTFGYEKKLHRPIGDGSYESCLRYVDWSLGGSSPRTLHGDDFLRLVDSPYLFARKFEAKESPALLKLLKGEEID